MIKQLSFACILGMILSVLMLQEDAAVRLFFGKHINVVIAELGHCHVAGRVTRLNFFEPSIELSDVSVIPREGSDWSWRARHLRVSFSWFDAIWYGLIGLDLTIDELDIHAERVDNTLPLLDHVARFLDEPPATLALYLQSLALNQCAIAIDDQAQGYHFVGKWSSESRQIGSLFKTVVSVTDATLLKNSLRLINDVETNLQVTIPHAPGKQGAALHVQGAAKILPDKGQQSAFQFSCDWTGIEGAIAITNSDRSVCVDQMHLYQGDDGLRVQGHAHAAIDTMSHFLRTYGINVDGIGGIADGSFDALLRDGAVQELTGRVDCKDMAYKDWRLSAPCGTTFEYRDGRWRGEAIIEQDQPWEIAGSWQWLGENGHCALRNVRSCAVPFFAGKSFGVSSLLCDLSVRADGHCLGSYRVHMHDNRQQQDEIAVSGQISLNPESWRANACFENFVCSVAGRVDAASPVHEIVCTNQVTHQQLLFTASPNNAKELSGAVSLSWFNDLLRMKKMEQLQGDGECAVRLLLDAQQSEAHVALRNGSIRVGHTYNFVKSVDASFAFDTQKKELLMRHFDCQLYKGSVHCNHATLQLDDAYAIAHLDVPCAVNHVLVNHEKDFFAIASGGLQLQYDAGDDKPYLRGSCVIDRSHIAGSFFTRLFKPKIPYSDSPLDAFKPFDVHCDIAIESKESVRVDTPFLQASAQLKLHIGSRLLDPEITGRIDLVSGALLFPYKPLRITHGSLLLLPHRMHDPVIEITAKNMIKHHAITLYVGGSLRDQQVSLTASPFLTKEQIVSLLFAGTKEKSLSMMMPTLMVNNLASFIFGNHIPSDIMQVLKKIPTPFDHIRLIPCLSDQTIRGGLKAAIEIDINERWRAFIQRNFSLTEDTRWEVEYLVSDDMSVRGIRDEHRDVGAEIEMRWKF